MPKPDFPQHRELSKLDLSRFVFFLLRCLVVWWGVWPGVFLPAHVGGWMLAVGSLDSRSRRGQNPRVGGAGACGYSTLLAETPVAHGAAVDHLWLLHRYQRRRGVKSFDLRDEFPFVLRASTRECTVVRDESNHVSLLIVLPVLTDPPHQYLFAAVDLKRFQVRFDVHFAPRWSRVRAMDAVQA